MTHFAQTTLGIFAERRQAEMAISELEDMGYNPKDISVIIRDRDVVQQVKTNTGASVAKGTATGAATGGTLGALTGLLVGVGAITIPGIGALFIGGPLAAALGLTGAAATTLSAATTGVLAGGLAGALVGFGMPEETAQVYQDRLKEGAIVLAVPTSNTIDHIRVEEVFAEYGADQIRTVGEHISDRSGSRESHARM